MTYIKQFIELHIATQTALLCLYLLFSSKFELAAKLYEHNSGYFYFLVIGASSFLYVVFTYVMKALGYNRVGVKADRASRARGYR